jgi:hypothetical protein
MCDRVREVIGNRLAAGGGHPKEPEPPRAGWQQRRPGTAATWLEEAAIPSRVIAELMGHASGRRDRGAAGSPMGRAYRETTPAMLARVTAALDDRIGHAPAVAAYLLRERQDRGRSMAERPSDLGWS